MVAHCNNLRVGSDLKKHVLGSDSKKGAQVSSAQAWNNRARSTCNRCQDMKTNSLVGLVFLSASLKSIVGVVVVDRWRPSFSWRFYTKDWAHFRKKFSPVSLMSRRRRRRLALADQRSGRSWTSKPDWKGRSGRCRRRHRANVDGDDDEDDDGDANFWPRRRRRRCVVFLITFHVGYLLWNSRSPIDTCSRFCEYLEY